jgi:hypothetical protein
VVKLPGVEGGLAIIFSHKDIAAGVKYLLRIRFV